MSRVWRSWVVLVLGLGIALGGAGTASARALPTVTSLSTLGVPAAGGAKLVVHGTGFVKVQAVVFYEGPEVVVKKVHVVNSRTLWIVTPRMAPYVGARVWVIAGSGWSPNGKYIDIDAMTPVQQFSAAAGSTTVRLTWPADTYFAAGSGRLVIRRGTSSYPKTAHSGLAVAAASLDRFQPTFSDTTVAPDTTYRYSAFLVYAGFRYSKPLHASVHTFPAPAAGTATVLAVGRPVGHGRQLSTPTPVAGIGAVTAVAVAQDQGDGGDAYALTADGRVWSW